MGTTNPQRYLFRNALHIAAAKAEGQRREEAVFTLVAKYLTVEQLDDLNRRLDEANQ